MTRRIDSALEPRRAQLAFERLHPQIVTRVPAKVETPLLAILGDEPAVGRVLVAELDGDLRGLPPTRVHVRDDEVVLDDSRRYAERAIAAGVDAELDVWIGMPHGFVTGIREFDAAP